MESPLKPNNIILNSGLAVFNEDDTQVSTIIDDTELKKSILNKLKWYSNSQLENISIQVEKGLVCLSGKVTWVYQKMVIASIVIKVNGVKEIVNKITVAPRGL